jgi:CBS-domain-containing membrane protein
VASLTDWHRFDALPVTNRKGKFVGMLTHHNLEKGLSFSTGDQGSDPIDSVLADCVSAYTSTLSWLVQTALPSSIDTQNK